MSMLARHIVDACAIKEQELHAFGARPVELLPQLQHLALTIAGQSMFSLEMAGFGTDLRALLYRYADRYARTSLLDLLMPASLPTPTDIGRAGFRRQWLALIDRMIDAREAQPATDGPRDLFDLLRAAEDPETGARFTRAELRDEVATMILAGHETTAVTLFWSCWLAARMPEHAEQVAKETEAADLSPAAAAAAMRNLPYTRAFIDEAMRLYPPAFMIVRAARGPDELLGMPVAKGTLITIAPWVLHRHRAHWHRPAVFDPARFLPGATPPGRYTYMPFGAGPRICVGAQFALTEAVIVLARLLRRFRIRFSGSGAVLPIGRVTTQPDRPVRFIFNER
jgi:unspecific monooxygenase